VAEGLSVRATEELVATNEAPATPRARASRAPKMPALARLEESLSDLLETKVTVELGRRRGKLTVSFASIDDLQRILGVLLPGVEVDSGGAAESPIELEKSPIELSEPDSSVTD
jgi:ParB family chromosome partitioning protein